MLPGYIDNIVWFVTVANLTLWIVAFWLVVGVFRAPLYHPIFVYLVYHFLGFVVRPFVIASSSYSEVWHRTGVYPDAETLIYGGVLVNLALFAVVGGFMFAMKQKSEIPLIPPAKIEVKNFRGLIIAAVIVTLLGVDGTYRSYGGAGLKTVNAFKAHVDSTGGLALEGVSGYELALAELMPTVCVMLFIIPRTRKASYFLIALFIGLRMYIGAERLSFVVVVAAIFFITMVNARKRYPAPALIALVICGALLFDVMGSDRFAFRKVFYGTASLSDIWDSYAHGTRQSNGLTTDLAEYDVAMACLPIVPEKSGFSYGSQYLRLFTWPVPRQLWEDKPVFTNIIKLSNYGNFWAYTHTLYIDTYMVIGLPSMILILFGVGLYLSKMYLSVAKTDSMLLYMFYWAQIIYLKTLFRDGEVTVFYFVAISVLGFYVLVTAGGVKLLKTRTSLTSRSAASFTSSITSPS